MQKILPQYIISAAKTTGIGVRHPRSGGYLFLNLSSVFALAMSFNHFKNIYQVSQIAVQPQCIFVHHREKCHYKSCSTAQERYRTHRWPSFERLSMDTFRPC